MTGFLLDTNVISLLAPTKAPAHENLVRWLEAEDAKGLIFLSVVTVHEIEKGISLLVPKGATSKAARLQIWLAGLAATYEDKILPIDTAVSTLSGRLEAAAVAAGHTPGMADALIAGTAKYHDLGVVTDNARHFATFDVTMISARDCRPD